MLIFSAQLLSDYMRTLEITGSGKDGVHRYAWKYGNRVTLEYLSGLCHAHMARGARPDDIDDSLTIFAPKGLADDDYIANPAAVF